jgi:hypothetical protein
MFSDSTCSGPLGYPKSVTFFCARTFGLTSPSALCVVLSEKPFVTETAIQFIHHTKVKCRSAVFQNSFGPLGHKNGKLKDFFRAHCLVLGKK